MKKEKELLAKYQAASVEGRSESCPRIGIYKINSVHNSVCFKKFALMAITKWKHSVNDEYSEDLCFIIQLESFKKQNGSLFLKPEDLINREIKVNTAINHPTEGLKLNWELLPIKPPHIPIKDLFAASGYTLNNSEDFGDQNDNGDPDYTKGY